MHARTQNAFQCINSNPLDFKNKRKSAYISPTQEPIQVLLNIMGDTSNYLDPMILWEHL